MPPAYQRLPSLQNVYVPAFGKPSYRACSAIRSGRRLSQAKTWLSLSSAISISCISSSLSRKSPASATPATCSGRRIPTIAPVTAGLASVQAMATSPGVRPWRLPILRSSSTSLSVLERRGCYVSSHSPEERALVPESWRRSAVRTSSANKR
jgi:hypothetical protein